MKKTNIPSPPQHPTPPPCRLVDDSGTLKGWDDGSRIIRPTWLSIFGLGVKRSIVVDIDGNYLRDYD